jgi:high-affinity nickel-transport protein
MAIVILGLHLLGFGLLVGLAATPEQHVGRIGALAFGTGLTAYTLGLRHAVDADHIAAIDNATRKLISDGQRPVTVGFWFSLGHSTIVVALAGLIGVGVRSLDGEIHDGASPLHAVAGVIGASVSGGFLYLIAALNLVVLLGLVRGFRQMRSGCSEHAGSAAEYQPGGVMYRVYGRVTRTVRRPWHMYPVGVLFGVGFDTASEVALLILAAGAAGAAVPLYTIVCLPILFAAGMSLLDTIDGSLMNYAYSWASARPVRRIYYNLVITGLSVAVALVIGTIELGGVLARQMGPAGSFWSWLEAVDINQVGLIVVGMFVGTCIVAALLWRLGWIEPGSSVTVADQQGTGGVR